MYVINTLQSQYIRQIIHLTALRVLFADDIELYRYSLILTAQACRSDLAVFEAGSILDTLAILQKEDIDLLFINITMLKDTDPLVLAAVKNTKIILVKDNSGRSTAYENQWISKYTMLNLEKSLDASKADISRIFHDLS
ncbi:hypothetical protein [Sphingobacterium corticibacter]|uniref:Response regulatory domain-containing protein n=1 Tax=Sphingobacterium corticibacter TaxID=2171749 RepID=A0A2T8HNF2_9SPHI|nr:hypothetical protein [Sphingobacterium corticibacter]PVH26967.1 hypothetical protein DC487_05070 [Sphingobacterium corticibacter]